MSKPTTLTGSSKQYIGVVDMICEGPIYGLLEGKNSVYLDNIPFENTSEVGSFTDENLTALPKVSDDPNVINAYDVTGLTLTQSDVGKYVVAEVASKSVTSISSATIPGSGGYQQYSITAGSNFNDDWNTYQNNLKFIVLENTTGTRIEAQTVGSTSNTLSVTAGRYRQFNSADSWTVILCQAVKILSISVNGDAFVGETGFDYTLSNAPFYIRDKTVLSTDNTDFNSTVGKVDGSTLQFRIGTQEQAPIQQVHGVSGGVTKTGSDSTVEIKQYYDGGNAPTLASYFTGIPLTQNTNGYPEGQSWAENGGTQRVFSASSFGAGSVGSEVDEVNIRINYQSLITYNTGGDREDAHAMYIFEIRTKDSRHAEGYEWTDWKRLFSQQGGYVTHKGKTTAPVSFDHTIGLERFKPFTDFNIRITRLTRHAGLPVRSDGGTGGETDRKKWTLQATAVTGGSNLSATIKDKFIYPHTAIAAISFSSKSFSNLPVRSYLLQGLKVRIPDSYTPREYSSDGIAKYDGYWSGNFKNQLYYTDNPAWVFYDIVTNNRYGAGRWLEGSEINKFALYRIAKYCDELVDDGNGGTEPRFRANIYLAKATDVYKVLKDMATVFTGMLYWLDGQLTPVQDVPSDPIYTFSKSNVINGAFNYESTGRKTRSNQVVVTWNDPNVNYEPTNLIVEDREDIVKTRKIISQKAVAMGATSEGQAIRYGRWKLWTAQNQKEVVTFETGLQGAYIRPGDVINIQDRDRYGVDYSGLIKEASASSITLDRNISSVSNASTFEISTVVTNFAAFYTGLDPLHIQDSTGYKVSSNPNDGTVTTFNRGDRFTSKFWYPDTTPEGGATFDLDPIPSFYSTSTDLYDSSVADAEKLVTNAFVLFAETNGPLGSTGLNNQSGYNYKPLPLEWKQHTYVVTKPVTVSGTTATPSSNYNTSEIPASGSVWALKTQDSEDVNILGSAKEYRVLGITHNDSKNTYGISAVEHYNNKYDAVDKDYALGVVPNNTFPDIEDPDADVPPPKNLYVVLETDSTTPGEELRIEWTKPLESYNSTNGNGDSVTAEREYEFLSGYELYHNIPDFESPILTSNTSIRFDKIPNGLYTFRVRSVSRKGNVSSFITTSYEVDDPFGSNLPRVVGGLPKGLITNGTADLKHDATLNDEEDRYTVYWVSGRSGKSIGNELNTLTSSTTLMSEVKLFGLSQSGPLAAMPQGQTPASKDGVGGDETWHYLLYDGNTHLAYYNDTTFFNLPFFQRLPANGWRGSPQTWYSVGTASLVANSNKLVGSGTSWLSTIQLRDIIHFDGAANGSTGSQNFQMHKIDALEEVSGESVVSVEVRPDAPAVIDGSTVDKELGYSNGDIVTFEEVAGATTVNGQFYYVKTTSDVNRVQLYKNEALTQPVRTVDLGGTYQDYSGFVTRAQVKAAKVVAIIDDETVLLDRTFEEDITSRTVFRYFYRPDYTDDAIWGRVKWNSYNSTDAVHTFSLEKFLIIDPGLEVGAKQVIVTPSDPIIQYNATGSQQITQPGAITVDVNAIGFIEPEFRLTEMTGAGSLDFETPTATFVAANAEGSKTKTFEIATESQGNAFPWDNGDAVLIYAEVREATNTGINATGSGQITKVTSGSDGIAGKTVNASSEDYSIIYDESGRNPIMNGSDQLLTITATAKNFTNPKFKFTFIGTNLQSTSNFTLAGNPGHASESPYGAGSGSYTWGDWKYPDVYQEETSTATIAIPDAYDGNWGNSKKQKSFLVRVEAQEHGDGSTTVQAFDEFLVIGVHALKGGYWAIVSNPAHTVVTDISGVPVGTANSNYVTSESSGTTIEVGKGSEILDYAGSSWGSLTNDQKVGKYILGTTPSGGSAPYDVTVGAINTSDVELISFGDHGFHNTAWTSETASITYTVELEDTSEYIGLSQSFSKSKQGFGGLAVQNTNQFESLPVDKNNNVLVNNSFDAYSLTATTINVFMSGLSLPYYADTTAANAGGSPKAWWTYGSLANNGITAAAASTFTAPSNGSTGALSIPAASAMTANTATITWTLNVYVMGADGAYDLEQLTTTQTITKNKNSSNISAYSTVGHYTFDSDDLTSESPASSFRINWNTTVPEGATPYVTIEGGTLTAATDYTSQGYYQHAAPNFNDSNGDSNYPLIFTVKLYNYGGSGDLPEPLDVDTVTISASKSAVDNVIMELTNDNETVSGSSGSAITGSPVATTTARIFVNGVDDSSNWNFAVSNQTSGLTGSMSGATYNVTEVAATFTDGTATITATKTGYAAHQKVFSISRVNDSAVYRIVATPSAVLYNPNNSTYTGGSGASNKNVVFNFYKIEDGVSSAYSGYYKINGGTLQSAATSYTYTGFGTSATSVSVQLWTSSSSGPVDEESVPLIISGTNGTPGNPGGPGGPGGPGPDGDNGDDGPRYLSGLLYATTNASTPTSATYNFDNNSFTNLGSWTAQPPAQSTSQAVIYYIYFYVEENISNGTGTGSGSLVFPGSAYAGTSFANLVVFQPDATTGNYLREVGASTNTLINGGAISTGTIDADRLTIGEEDRTSSRILLLNNSLKVFEGTSLRVHLGNLSNTDT